MSNSDNNQIKHSLFSYPYILEFYYTKLGISKELIQRHFVDSMTEEYTNNGSIVSVQEQDDAFGIAIYGISNFDTKVLEMETAKIKAIISSDTRNLEKLITNLLKELSIQKVKYATIRFSPQDRNLEEALSSHKFNKVDDYIILSKHMDANPTIINNPDVNIREAVESDIAPLQQNHAHTFTYSRYFNDSAISVEKATLVHRLWIENSIMKRVADRVLVATDSKNDQIGFISMQLLHEYGRVFGHIPLIAVKSEYSGKKVGRLLLSSALRIFSELKVTDVFIETQGSNINALNSYKHSGFEEIGNGVTYSRHSQLD